LTLTFRTLVTEFHPHNRAAETVTDKIRVTGLVVLVTAIVSFAALAATAVLVGRGLLPATALLPTPAQMLHAPTIALAAVVGGLIITSFYYFGFSAVVKITTENLIAATAFMPLVILAVQLPATWLGLIRPIPFEPLLLASMGVIIAGVLVILWAGRAR
jgi:hypothetical protein